MSSVGEWMVMDHIEALPCTDGRYTQTLVLFTSVLMVLVFGSAWVTLEVLSWTFADVSS